MPFTDAEKTDLRRFCGYPPSGTAGGYGLLEYRLNHLTDAEAGIVRRYLGTLAVLEHAVPRAGDNLDTDQAATWSRNREEPRDRLRLFDDWRRRLCGFLGVPPGPAMTGGSLYLVV